MDRSHRSESAAPLTMDARLARAFEAIDAVNADDPNTLQVRGERRKKEHAHAELACAWVRQLEPDASDALLVAARAHHIKRWALPRVDYPAGRSGYLRWRKALQKLHARTVRELLEKQEWPEEEIRSVEDLVAKRRLGRDAEAQALEDAICLVFVETQLSELSDRLDDDHMVDVLRKTMKKMSARAIELAASLPENASDKVLLERAAALD